MNGVLTKRSTILGENDIHIITIRGKRIAQLKVALQKELAFEGEMQNIEEDTVHVSLVNITLCISRNKKISVTWSRRKYSVSRV